MPFSIIQKKAASVSTCTRRFLSFVLTDLGRENRQFRFDLESWPTSEEGPSNRSADRRSIVSQRGCQWWNIQATCVVAARTDRQGWQVSGNGRRGRATSVATAVR